VDVAGQAAADSAVAAAAIAATVGAEGQRIPIRPQQVTSSAGDWATTEAVPETASQLLPYPILRHRKAADVGCNAAGSRATAAVAAAVVDYADSNSSGPADCAAPGSSCCSCYTSATPGTSSVPNWSDAFPLLDGYRCC